jgi:hypothetical protein
MNLHDLIGQAAFAWISQEKANAQSVPGQIARHIGEVGKLRFYCSSSDTIYIIEPHPSGGVPIAS